MVGAVLSTTVTVCVAVELFPLASVAVYVTVVVPTGKMFPAGTPLRVTVTAPPQLSLVLADPSVTSETRVPHAFASAPVLTVTFEGAVTDGAVVSATVRLVVAVVVLPTASVAVTVIVWVPRPTDVPAAGL